MVMGCRSSCQIFEKFSRAIQWVRENKFEVKDIVDVLDDFFFAGPTNAELCGQYLKKFYLFCSKNGNSYQKGKNGVANHKKLNF